MAPSAALHDPIFRSYAVIVLGVLVSAGLLLALLHWVFRVELGSVWKTYLSWLWLAPLAAFFIFAGRVPFIIGITALSVLAAREFLRLAGPKLDSWMTGVVYIGLVGFGLAAIARVNLSLWLGPILLLLLLVPILQNRSAGVVAQVSLGWFTLLATGWMFGQLSGLANSSHPYGYLCFLLLATEVSDVAAFTCGKIFGRHPLRSVISPRKTWEGALGALLVAPALPWLLRFSFPFFTPTALLLAGLIVGLGGQLGDLAFSALKRDLGAKDWGAAIPGHGGVLDRIDSLIFVAPLFMLLTNYYNPGQ